MSSVLEIIENKDIDLSTTDCYAAILGESPSKGAKSPVLWNAAFKKLGISGTMRPMDILPERLGSVVDCLREDKKFIGGAVTMPYKIDIIPYLDALEPEAEMIGAVNCLYRQGEKLMGANTDGAGALWSLQAALGESLTGKTVLLLGTGGAGLAVAAYVASVLGQEGKLVIANRSSSSRNSIAQKLVGQCRIQNVEQWPIAPDCIKSVDVLINCTSVGFETIKQDEQGAYSVKYFSPLSFVDDNIRVPNGADVEQQFIKAALPAIAENFKYAVSVLSEMDRQLLVFDIICQPKETVLLNWAKLVGCKTLNGLPMNLEQAVIAFVKATGSVGLYDGGVDKVRSIMNETR